MKNKFSRIIFIDDSDLDNFLAEELLLSLNASENIMGFTSPLAALKFLESFPSKATEENPELILLDLNMPEMTGLEFLENFKKRKDDHVHVVIITSSEEDEDIEVTSQHGVSGYIEKPLSKDKLSRVFSVILMTSLE